MMNTTYACEFSIKNEREGDVRVYRVLNAQERKLGSTNVCVLLSRMRASSWNSSSNPCDQ